MAATKKQASRDSNLHVVDGGVEVRLDGKTRILKWSNSAMFRASMKGFQSWDPERSIACMVVFVWAMLENRDDIEPEDVADMLPLNDEKEIKNLVEAITKAVDIGGKK